MTGKEATKILKCEALNNPDYPLVGEAMSIGIECINTCEYLKQVLEDAEAQHPYRVSGKPETYSDYNQGWQDALIFIDASLDWSEYK